MLASLKMKDKIDLFFKNNEHLLKNLYPGLRQDYFQDVIEKIFEKILTGYPLEYLMGGKYFYNGWIQLGEGIFIPRYETEWIVEKSLQILKKEDEVLDLCCGPGTIGVALLRTGIKNKITFVDLNPRALSYVKKNTLEYHEQVNILESSLFKEVKTTFDLILVNPPYLKKGQSYAHPQTFYEPEEALYIPHDFFIRDLVQGLKNYLNFTGTFLLEGEEEFLIEFEREALQQGFEIKLEKDLADRWRYAQGSFAKNR